MNLSYSPSAATNYPTERGSQVIGWGAFSDDVRLIIRHTLSDWSLYIFSTDELQQHWANKVHQPHSRARARTHTHIHTYTHVCTYTHRLTPPTHTHTHTHIHTRGGGGVHNTTLSPPKKFCVKVGSGESHCNISLVEGTKVPIRQCPYTTLFEEKGQPQWNRTQVHLFTSLATCR